MRYHEKPIRKCHGCGLNRGNHCWLFAYPRGQWRGYRRCRAFGDKTLEHAYAQWRKQPDVKGRKALRRGMHRQRKPTVGGEGAAWAREQGFL